MQILRRAQPHYHAQSVVEYDGEPAVRCCKCGCSNVKMTYRHYDNHHSGPRGRTLIYRCDNCDQFTTVRS